MEKLSKRAKISHFEQFFQAGLRFTLVVVVGEAGSGGYGKVRLVWVHLPGMNIEYHRETLGE